MAETHDAPEPQPAAADGTTAIAPTTTADRHDAAQLIQRNYRGYKQRRELEGLGLSAQTRWIEAVKELQYRNLTRPQARREWSSEKPSGPDRADTGSSDARRYWKRAAQIAERAGSDDTSDTEGEDGMTEAQLEEYRRKKLEAKREREKNAKIMGLEYFLEMVDVKHRYGSHLRAYHAVWQKADTNENFFYWLEYGDGKDVVTTKCDREKLERDQVRYLSREERKYYQVKIDDEGRLRWLKNGERITTRNDVKDSLRGIVPEDDPTPSFRGSKGQAEAASGSSYESDSSLEQKEPKDHKVSVESVAKRRKKKWIYPGAFQHSSFLHGARIAAAGQIKIKDGQLRELSPLSGHYRPPTTSFRGFVHSLREEGVDLSRVSIPRSYAVLLGVQTYKQSRNKVKLNMQEFKHRKDKILNPEEARKAEEAKLDKSQSAAREREFLAQEKARQEESKKSKSLVHRLFRPKSSSSPDSTATS